MRRQVKQIDSSLFLNGRWKAFEGRDNRAIGRLTHLSNKKDKRSVRTANIEEDDSNKIVFHNNYNWRRRHWYNASTSNTNGPADRPLGRSARFSVVEKNFSIRRKVFVASFLKTKKKNVDRIRRKNLRKMTFWWYVVIRCRCFVSCPSWCVSDDRRFLDMIFKLEISSRFVRRRKKAKIITKTKFKCTKEKAIKEKRQISRISHGEAAEDTQVCSADRFVYKSYLTFAGDCMLM